MLSTQFTNNSENSGLASWQLREKFLPIPGPTQGFTRLMFLGTTGAGKTSLIRQLIGTSPDELNFPAVSASRTTTCDTEFILANRSTFSGVVTFLPREKVQTFVEESVSEAIKSAYRGEDTKLIAEALLIHPEQRFRLYYLLGRYKQPKPESEPFQAGNRKAVDPPYPDQQSLFSNLENFVNRIQSLADSTRNLLNTSDLDLIDDAFDESIKEDGFLRKNLAYQSLISDIIKQIMQRFYIIQYGRVESDSSGWPIYWLNETKTRIEMLNQLRWFAGNESQRFGQLLTPLVDGIRLAGPFQPSWWKSPYPPPLVIIDGEGVGHDSRITTSLKVDVTGRFEAVDAIALVDNAAQPMVGIPNVIMQEVAVRGYSSKLLIGYTHFDQVSGSNLSDKEEKQDHVLASQNSALKQLQDSKRLSSATVMYLRNHLSKHTFFFPEVQKLNDISIDFQFATVQF